MNDNKWTFCIAGSCMLFLSGCSHWNTTLFTALNPSDTKIQFANEIREDENNNIYNFMNFYTGAGVGIGDINNDGLPDIFFAGNLVSNKLYLNNGNLEFEDITKSAGLENDQWCSGVSMVDINQDGWLDIYVCVSGSASIEHRANLLYINNKDNTFSEKAKEYGLADTAQATQAAFFDYDKDGDLDMFLIINPVNYSQASVNSVRSKLLGGQSESTDKLYRNNGDRTFTDVSSEAGISIEGYSLGLGVSDLDNDGWPDIYISNDFLTNDVMYINNGDGTFTDKSNQRLKHTSFAGMGNDLSDVNNDGLTDIMVLDMLPEDNKRQKNLIPAASFDKFQMLLDRGYQEQYTRNTLQINNGNNSFSETGYLSGISSTDWSWSVLLADYDNNGTKDVFVSNGFARDLGNLDYINYQQQSSQFFGTDKAKKKNRLKAITELPSVPIPNYFFRNNGDLTFTDTSKEWGIEKPSLSNGAAYADLDNDGDLDLVVSNINEKATILRNNSDRLEKHHFLKVNLKGPRKNLAGLGTKILVSANGINQYQQKFLTRGYESSVDGQVHFGLGKANIIDSITVIWPDDKIQILRNIKPDTTITISHLNSKKGSWDRKQGHISMFKEVSKEKGIDYQQHENSFIDFNVQPLLPYMHSKLGPKLAVGDIDGDGLEDFYVGGAHGYSGRFFMQQENGGFYSKNLEFDVEKEDTGSVLFDADGDGDLDLYVVSGGSEFKKDSSDYQDRLYTNDGKGNFSPIENALPIINSSGSVVEAGDYDGDGDLDLFVGGRIVPGEYPLPPRSYILDNENGSFKDVTELVCPSLGNIGMVTSALWTDFDTDGSLDLMVAGEFMQVKVLKNDRGYFKDVTDEVGLKHSYGWWNSIAEGDFDNDGDIDYLVGNHGTNSRYTASASQPLCIYAKDYDKNGTIDPIMCLYIQGKDYPAASRDAMVQQISAMRGRFKSYEDYSKVTFKEAFTPEELDGAYVAKCETLYSSYIENLGNGSFSLHKLPVLAQLGPINGIQVFDIDGDGNLDALLVGNNYSGDASVGNSDAMVGLSIMGDGRGGFSPRLGTETGFFVDSDAKDIKIINSKNGKKLILVGSNSDKLKAFEKLVH
ncbi:VCBS repeat-containing protein [Flavobacteriaceae bacterium F89]|uniref:VCBS repeat-containing protein n=1 Tax=Cerina litoralis TaxID=2874477 RepID=A0AAE3EY05_9FLAO|nr:VCBS repeat-containing protein [Cerina litoralis]MCG2461661.1 VCBS repeat-containing protein [Cerina litoralis]